MTDMIFSVQEFLKVVPGLIMIPLSFYLGWKKVGSNVSCVYSIASETFSETRISNVVLTNKKDKPIVVFEIFIIIDNEIRFQVERFEVPLILKPLEASVIITGKYSSIVCDEEEFEISKLLFNKIEVYLSTASGVLKCASGEHPGLTSFMKFPNISTASKITKSHNGIVFNSSTVYAIDYRINSDAMTLLVDNSGIVSPGWHCGNMIPFDRLNTPKSLSDFLAEIDPVNTYFVTDLRDK